MSVIVTDAGFRPAPPADTVPLADLDRHRGALDLAHVDDPAPLAGRLGEFTLIRVAFPAFNDGRAFTLAATLRRMGYGGELRALGPVIADQYAMCRRVGFDAVEIPDELAARQPEAQWRFRSDWRAHDYQARLRA
jgi:uncharacterized protein (DUF934 family)